MFNEKIPLVHYYAQRRSQFKNSPFLFHQGLQALENNKNPNEISAFIFEMLLQLPMISLA